MVRKCLMFSRVRVYRTENTFQNCLQMIIKPSTRFVRIQLQIRVQGKQYPVPVRIRQNNPNPSVPNPSTLFEQTGLEIDIILDLLVLVSSFRFK